MAGAFFVVYNAGIICFGVLFPTDSNFPCPTKRPDVYFVWLHFVKFLVFPFFLDERFPPDLLIKLTQQSWEKAEGDQLTNTEFGKETTRQMKLAIAKHATKLKDKQGKHYQHFQDITPT